MGRLVTPNGIFELFSFETETPFEKAVIDQAKEIFGENRIYLDCKRRIGNKDGKKSIPDAYLFDFSRRRDPQLYIVENEIVAHDVFKHIGVQLLQFSVSFKQDGHKVKSILHEEISSNQPILSLCEKYAQESGFRNLDYLLEHLIFKTGFKAVVVIDESQDELTDIRKQFNFPVEVVEFKTYKDMKGSVIYSFEPFLGAVNQSDEQGRIRDVDVASLDTIIVPAREEGFKKVFLGENRWFAIRLNQSMIPQIKYIAGYQVAPVSAITHYAEVKNIEVWENTDKYVLNFVHPAEAIGPLPNSSKPGERIQIQGPRYASSVAMMKAKTLKDIFE